MISLIRFIRANWLYGKAASKMKKEQYVEAIDILKTVIKLENKKDANAIPMFDLGYCFYKRNDPDEALYWFSKSYEIYRKNSEKFQSEPFYQLLIHYSYLLQKKGEVELADKISAEAEKFRKQHRLG